VQHHTIDEGTRHKAKSSGSMYCRQGEVGGRDATWRIRRGKNGHGADWIRAMQATRRSTRGWTHGAHSTELGGNESGGSSHT
jgi:hypothetical protein